MKSMRLGHRLHWMLFYKYFFCEVVYAFLLTVNILLHKVIITRYPLHSFIGSLLGTVINKYTIRWIVNAVILLIFK